MLRSNLPNRQEHKYKRNHAYTNIKHTFSIYLFVCFKLLLTFFFALQTQKSMFIFVILEKLLPVCVAASNEAFSVQRCSEGGADVETWSGASSTFRSPGACVQHAPCRNPLRAVPSEPSPNIADHEVTPSHGLSW